MKKYIVFKEIFNNDDEEERKKVFLKIVYMLDENSEADDNEK